MRHLIIYVSMLLCGLTQAGWAQTNEPAQKRQMDDAFMQASPAEQRALLADTVRADSALAPATTDETPIYLPLTMPIDEVQPYCFTPDWGWSGFGLGGRGFFDGGWQLHEGFNAHFGMTVGTALGKSSPKGAFFGQTAALAYAKRVTPKLTVAASLYARHSDWSSRNANQVGVAAMMNYQVNERVNVSAWASKSFIEQPAYVRNARRMTPYFWEEPKSRVGAAAEWKIGEHAKIDVSVEHVTY